MMNLVVVTAVLEEEVRVEWVQECVEMGSGEMEIACLDNCSGGLTIKGRRDMKFSEPNTAPHQKREREKLSRKSI